MTIYADVLVITNLYIDFFLLWCVRRFLHLHVKGRRMVAGALAGALCCLFTLPPEQPHWLSLLLSAATAFATTAAAFVPLPLRMYLKSTLCFGTFSFLLAGFFLFLIRFFSPKGVTVLGSAVYFDLSPFLLFFFTAGAYLLFLLLHRIFPPENSSKRYWKLEVEHQGERAELFAKADTGNALREPFSGLPVIVCQADALGNTVPHGVLEFLKTGSAAETLRLVPFQTLGGNGLLPAFRPEHVLRLSDRASLECYVALWDKKLSAGQFNALFNPDLFPEFSEKS